MKVALSKIKPSPWNPKKAFSVEDRKRLEGNIDKFGFSRALVVCKDYKGGDGFICLDGNTALEILSERGVKSVEIVENEYVKDDRTLKKFITAFDYTRKKYVGSQLIAEIGDAFSSEELKELINFDPSKYDLKVQDIVVDYEEMETEQFFITLPKGTAQSCRRKFKKATPRKSAEKIEAILEKMSDEDVLKAILTFESEKQTESR